MRTKMVRMYNCGLDIKSSGSQGGHCCQLTSFERHHSMASCRARKCVLVSTSRVSRIVCVCRVTVRSSTTGKLKVDNGVTSFECSNERSDTHLWCSFCTLSTTEQRYIITVMLIQFTSHLVKVDKLNFVQW